MRRFFARRGHSSLFLSDNGRSFTALSRILRGTLKWNVIPPASPWWGGFWERLIGTIKRSCLKTLGNVSLTHSEFVTTLAELEDIVNRRPLTASLSDDDDCLTPSHFLHGVAPAPICQPIVSAHSTPHVPSSFERLRELQEHRRMISLHLWSRWRREYLTSLRTWRRPNSKGKFQLRENDVVIIAPPDGVKIPRHKWALGRVSKLFPGRDGQVRACELQTGNSTVRRPIQRLYPLECNSG